jgi:hypothetical protein
MANFPPLCLAKTLLGFGIKGLRAIAPFLFLGYIRAMFAFIRLCLDTIGRVFRGRRSLLLEDLACVSSSRYSSVGILGQG